MASLRDNCRGLLTLGFLGISDEIHYIPCIPIYVDFWKLDLPLLTQVLLYRYLTDMLLLLLLQAHLPLRSPLCATGLPIQELECYFLPFSFA